MFTNRSGQNFAEKLSKELNIPISSLETFDFADGESKIIVNDSVRGCDAYLVQNCFDPNSKRSVQDNLLELLQAGDALKRAGASKLTAILPFHPFSRQDKSFGREPLTARLIADLIEVTGFDNLITSELHAKQIEGFYKKTKLDNLPATHLLVSQFKEDFPEVNGDLVVISPDAGGAKRAEHFAKKLNSRAAQAFKIRRNPNEVEELKVAGLVENYNVLIIDDMIDTGGSVVKLVEKLKAKKTNKILVCCTHSLLNKNAVENLKNSGINLISTDSIERTEEFKNNNNWYKEISLAPLFAQVIKNLNENKSVSGLYEGNNF